MDAWSPSFRDYLGKAEAKLSGALGGTCRVAVYHEMNRDILRIIAEIEDERFRSELRYSEKELTIRSKKRGFTCFIVYLGERPVAFVFGFDDPERGAYFSDSAATLIERKGVGSILTALETLYCIEKGYVSEKMITEDLDESGRRLVEYWARFGFYVTGRDPKIGVEMRLEITQDVVKRLLDKYLGN
ncbi:MAG: hypothetical protein NTV61_03055 [Candidatus Bathyarchaeota archaeon]|nr:hypothetical protein [Candidatus Bathyarchaeota archaeon]